MDIKKVNTSVIKQIMPKDSLEILAKISEMKYLGHIRHS